MSGLRITTPLLLFDLAVLALGIYVAVDAGRYPEWAYERLGSRRINWQVWPVLGGLFCGIVAIVFAVLWLTSKRRDVAAAASGGGPDGGSPRGGGWPPPPAPPGDGGWPPSPPSGPDYPPPPPPPPWR